MKISEAQDRIRSKSTVDDSGCWLWPEPKRRYGRVSVGGKVYAAHRLSYLVFKGQIEDRVVCHSCDVPLCVNPDHLFLGTQQDNMDDMVSKGRSVTNNRPRKLTDEQVREIRARRQRGIPAAWIAEDFDISAAYVRDIVTRRVKSRTPTRQQA